MKPLPLRTISRWFQSGMDNFQEKEKYIHFPHIKTSRISMLTSFSEFSSFRFSCVDMYTRIGTTRCINTWKSRQIVFITYYLHLIITPTQNSNIHMWNAKIIYTLINIEDNTQQINHIVKSQMHHIVIFVWNIPRCKIVTWS